MAFKSDKMAYECPICHGKMRDRGTTTAYPSCKGLFMLERVKACDFCGIDKTIQGMNGKHLTYKELINEQTA